MLTDLIPAKYRKAVYALAALAGLVGAAYKAAHGDWTAFGENLGGSLIFALAHQNTAPASD